MDLVIRHAKIVDGTGSEPFEGDIAIGHGRIMAVGQVNASGKDEIDAGGMIVTPGFVDIHTHYDGQASWQNRLDPSSKHGVTTVVMGNCGVGFAPCRADEHETLLNLMAGVEDIPEVVMADGVPWDWETYPEYLNFLAQREFDIDIASFVPHAALRLYVMGQRACGLEPATAQDREAMSALLKEALQAGALGLGTSQTINHRSTDGISIPTLRATETELLSLIMTMREVGYGIFQYVTDFPELAKIGEQFQMMERLTQQSGRPLTFTLTQQHLNPKICRPLLDKTIDAKARGLQIMAQFYPRPVGVILGHELSMNPFYSTPTYLSLSSLPFDALIARLRDPDIRRKILSEKLDPQPAMLLGLRVANFEEIYPLGDPPDYEPTPDSSIARLAAARGILPAELAYDLMLENDGHTLLYMATANYADQNLDMCRTAFCHEGTVIGLGDGGAHMGSICDASYPTFMLTHWVRDRKRGPKLPLPMVIEAMTRRTAQLVGLNDRGILAPGYRADINIIDIERLRLGSPYIIRDLPAGGRRLMQDAQGYRATIVNGVVTYRGGKPTGALPGRLVRGPQHARVFAETTGPKRSFP
jgi:N-acyl-D-aspartate/D-glutamate deacylase